MLLWINFYALSVIFAYSIMYPSFVWSCPASIMDFHKVDIIFGIFFALTGPLAILLCCVVIPIQG
jgi:hypothetical protein